jgi:glycosyltransferase involved in cell wall biosynthesis
MIKILHIIQSLSQGGACRSMITMAKYSSRLGEFKHHVISLKSAHPNSIELAKEGGMTVTNAPNKSTIVDEIASADIVQVHFWNNPEIYDFFRSQIPVTRLLVWVHIRGDIAPQVITRELLNYANFTILTCPYSYDEIPLVKQTILEVKYAKTKMIYAPADFERLSGLQFKPHNTFNVGYVGNLKLVKIHPDYIPMSSKIDIPNIKFIVCGGGENEIKQQAIDLGVAEKFDFRGYVGDIKSAIEVFDVYGYPLCPETFAAAELNLQEVMYAGVPPIVFPYGGVKNLVIHNQTGIVVNSELEYKEAVEYLYHHPEERTRLGSNAKNYARENFGGENCAKQLNPIYQELMESPKKIREWGLSLDFDPLKAFVNLEDLSVTENVENLGAKLFIETLGDNATHFAASITESNLEKLFVADQKIASSLPVLCNSAAGILQYSLHYPKDGYLKLWLGLVQQKQKKDLKAIEQFKAAAKLGCNHWRVWWYLAKSAEKISDFQLARQALDKVIANVPDFVPALTMKEYIGKNFIKIAHIINPVIVNESSDLHIAQPITFDTMKAAQQKAQGKVDVTLYTAQYPEDDPIIPEGFIKTPHLDRSILDIGKFQLPRKLPLIKDILDRLYKVAPEADYFIYTNADIALQPHFYTEVAKLIEKGYDAFVINRRTIPDHYKDISEIPQMYTEKGSTHPGHDCFIFKRSLYDKFYLENHVIGVGLCFRPMLLNCLCHTEKFQEFTDLHLTFHIGNKEMWKDSKLQDYLQHNTNEVQKVFDYYLHYNLLPNHPLIGRLFSRFINVEPLTDAAFKAEIIASETLVASPGEKVEIQATVKNISKQIWLAGYISQIRLGNHWLDENGSKIQNDDGRTYLPQVLKPTESIDLPLKITIPETPGNYLLELDMVQERVAWFQNKGSQTTRVKVEVSPVKIKIDTNNRLLTDAAFKAEIIASETLVASPGEKVEIQATVKNISKQIWLAGYISQIRLGNHWLDENGSKIQNDDGRTYLPQVLKPTESIDLPLKITIPETPGNYLLELDMVQERVAWFQNKGSQTTRVKVEVSPVKIKIDTNNRLL